MPITPVIPLKDIKANDRIKAGKLFSTFLKFEEIFFKSRYSGDFDLKTNSGYYKMQFNNKKTDDKIKQNRFLRKKTDKIEEKQLFLSMRAILLKKAVK